MDQVRWWNIIIPSSAVGIVVLLFFTNSSTTEVIGVLAATAAFVGSWFIFGSACETSPRASVALALCLIVSTAVGTAFEPWFATMQAIAYPLLWVTAPTTRRAIIANVGLAVSVGFALFWSTGADGEALISAALTAGFSITFSIAIGLWITTIEVRSESRRVLLDELREAQAQLADLSRDAGITSERERLAREIHDTIAQDLTGIVLLAQQAARAVKSGDTAAASEQLAALEEGARTALAETRALVAASAPPALEAGGIAAALDRLGERFERETAIIVSISTAVELELERDLEVVLLRCAQEGLANVRKHSGASRAAVTLVVRSDQRSLRVSDNGAGFNVRQQTDGYGLSGMHDRLALVGGTLDVDSGEDGTTLLITLPTGVTA